MEQIISPRFPISDIRNISTERQDSCHSQFSDLRIESISTDTLKIRTSKSVDAAGYNLGPSEEDLEDLHQSVSDNMVLSEYKLDALGFRQDREHLALWNESFFAG